MDDGAIKEQLLGVDSPSKEGDCYCAVYGYIQNGIIIITRCELRKEPLEDEKCKP